jgi:hypothetical protein
MTIVAGDNRELYRPLRQDGNWEEEAIGSHKGHMSYLNVHNAQPGRHYYWTLTNPKAIRRAKSQGWIFITKEDPEWSGNETYNDVIGAGLDTTVTRNEIALCWMPEGKYKERQEARRRILEEQQGDTSAEYLEKGRPLQEIYGQGIYFKRHDHGFRRSEQ